MASDNFAAIRQWALAGCPQETHPNPTCSICLLTELCLPGPGREYDEAQELTSEGLDAEEEEGVPFAPNTTWEPLAVLVCGHVVGYACFIRWITKCNEGDQALICPVCRYDLRCACRSQERNRDTQRFGMICVGGGYVVPKVIDPKSTPQDITRVPLTVAEGADVRPSTERACVACHTTYHAVHDARKAFFALVAAATVHNSVAEIAVCEKMAEFPFRTEMDGVVDKITDLVETGYVSDKAMVLFKEMAAFGVKMVVYTEPEERAPRLAEFQIRMQQYFSEVDALTLSDRTWCCIPEVAAQQ